MSQKVEVISLRKDQFTKLCNELNVKRSAVYNALNHTSNSESAQKIRRLAMSDYGGRITSKIVW